MKIHMQPRMVNQKAKTLVGMHIETTLSENRTFELWNSFKSRLKEIPHCIPDVFYSIQDYPHPPGTPQFKIETPFTKWAAIEVTKQAQLPDGFDSLYLPPTTYAVFTHRGPAHTFPQTMEYIFKTYFPNSNYEVSHGPQFEIMDKNYLGSDHPDSEEEVWIPVMKK